MPSNQYPLLAAPLLEDKGYLTQHVNEQFLCLGFKSDEMI